MATSHFCNGKWRDGTVDACPKHKNLSKKQTSVYRSADEESTSGSGKDSTSSSSESGSSNSGSSSGDSA